MKQIYRRTVILISILKSSALKRFLRKKAYTGYDITTINLVAYKQHKEVYDKYNIIIRPNCMHIRTSVSLFD